MAATITSELVELVPLPMRRTVPRLGRTPYEVLVYHTEREWRETIDEKETRKRIIAKFSEYGDAVLYARELCLKGNYHKIIVRA